MELTIIGSGTVFPSATRRPPAYLLCQDGFTALLDAGPGTLSALAARGVGPGDLDAVFVTHLHPDHALDLAHLLFLQNLGEEGQVKDELTLIGPPGFHDELNTWMDAIYPHAVDTSAELTWVETEQPHVRVGPWSVTAVPVSHRATAPSGAVGYYIESTRGIVSYTGDTGLCSQLKDLLDRRGAFICECTQPDDDPLPGHLSPSQIRDLVQKNPPRLLVLTHIGPGFHPERMPLPGPAFEGYPGRVVAAEDGMVLSFDPGYIHTEAPSEHEGSLG